MAKKKNTETDKAEFIARVQAAMLAGIIIGDGHTLFSPEFYAPFFTEEELAKAGLLRTHKSDGTYKGSIHTADGVVAELKAVYNLSFLEWVGHKVGATEYPWAEGRGFRAQQWVDIIRKTIAPVEA